MIYHLDMLAPPTESLVLDFEAARTLVEKHASKLSPRGDESVDLLQSAGRVVAEPIVADRDIPPFRRATRDGYALRARDVANVPAKLRIIGEIKAGPGSIPSALQPGETFSIMTGAPVPAGADAVVMVEYTTSNGDQVEIIKSVFAEENIVPQGAEARCGTLLLDRGTRLDHAAIALAASVGKSRLRVFARPRVAILTTGDEIVGVDSQPGPSQIRNSNTYSLATQVQESGGEPVLLHVAPDEPRRLLELVEQGLLSDALIMTGGVSMGRYDLVELALAELHAEFLFTGVKIQPGKPAVFGRVSCGARTGAAKDAVVRANPSPSHKYFFGLPGNPVSTMVTFELFARPIIEALGGMSARPILFLHAHLKSDIRVKTGLTRFLPAILSGSFKNTQVEIVPWQGSGDIAARARANCFIVVPPDREHIPAGEWVAIMQI